MLEIDINDLTTLKRKLPVDWVKRVQKKVGFGGTKIRLTLSDPKNYNPEIIDAALKVAEEFEKEKQASISLQKEKIKQLAAL
jgi:hypothetical protein